ncbi:hypothetical protein WJX77_012385 [Trebouxia sp. C0004]
MLLRWLHLQAKAQHLNFDLDSSDRKISLADLQTQGQQIHESCQAKTKHRVEQRGKCKPRWLTEEEVAALGVTPEAMRQHGIHDAVLTELQYARCFWEIPQICRDRIFSGLQQQLALFLLFAMVNLTYQRAVRLFSDGETGELKYSPLTHELRAFLAVH